MTPFRPMRDNGGLQQRNGALAADVAELKSEDGGAAGEGRARSELGMIKPGETFYRVVEDRRPASADEAETEAEGGPCARTSSAESFGRLSQTPAAAPASEATCPSRTVTSPANSCWRMRRERGWRPPTRTGRGGAWLTGSTACRH